MENLIESIRFAVANDATTEQRVAGASACRTILTALEATPGMTIASPQLGTQLAALASALRGMPIDQVLDLAIAKLTTIATERGATAAPVRPLAFQLIPFAGARP